MESCSSINSARSAREIRVPLFLPTIPTRYLPLLGPSVNLGPRTITHSRSLRFMTSAWRAPSSRTSGCSHPSREVMALSTSFGSSRGSRTPAPVRLTSRRTPRLSIAETMFSVPLVCTSLGDVFV